jgi:septal ring factor EnvC (AmiA/AmiB activator)
MSTSINRQSMISQAIKNGLDANVANYLGDSQLRQWVCNKGGVIQSKAAVVANAESHIKKDNIIAQQQVTIAALSNQPQANPQQLVDKQNEIKRLNAVNAAQNSEITQLKRQVANLQKDLAQSETDLENTQVALLLEKAKVAAKNKVIANLVEANKQALGFIKGM